MRSRLFSSGTSDSASKSREEESKTSHGQNPLDLIPQFAKYKQLLLDKQQDWNTLGGSRCSYNKHLKVLEKHKKLREKAVTESEKTGDFNSHLSTQQQQQYQHQEGESHLSKSASIFHRSLRGVGTAAHKLGSLALNSTLALEGYIEKTLAKELEAFKSEPNSQNQSTQSSNNHYQTLLNTQQFKMPPAQDHDFPTNIQHNHEVGSAGQPIPEAVLVYHESAHSIVFRDHLRRQLNAIRRTTTDMESSMHNSQHFSSMQQSRHSSVHSGIIETPGGSTDNSEKGYRPSDSSDVGYESAGSRESHGSLDRSERGGSTRKHLLRKEKNNKQQPAMHTVAVANFQPVVEPLERLELNASDVFQPLLDADPVADLEGKCEGGGLGLSEAEIEGENTFG